MTMTEEQTVELERIANEIAQAWPTMDAYARVRLNRDDGDRVGTDLLPDAVAWVRDVGTDKATVVLWAGNRLDDWMNSPVEVSIETPAVEIAVWAEWKALGEDPVSPVKTIARKLKLTPAEVAAIVYPPEMYGEWADDQEPDVSLFTLDSPPWGIVGYLEATLRSVLTSLERGDPDWAQRTIMRALADMPPKRQPAEA